jgi:hypothetical protein
MPKISKLTNSDIIKVIQWKGSRHDSWEIVRGIYEDLITGEAMYICHSDGAEDRAVEAKHLHLESIRKVTFGEWKQQRKAYVQALRSNAPSYQWDPWKWKQ